MSIDRIHQKHLAKLRKGDLEIIAKYGAMVPSSHTIIEIGTGEGGSTVILANSSKSRIYTIDPVYIPWRGAIWRKRLVEDRITFFHCTSREYKHDGSPVGLVFIDGDHSERTVEHDWRKFSKYIDEGYVLFHDYGKEKLPHIKKLVDSIGVKERKGYTAVVKVNNVKS